MSFTHEDVGTRLRGRLGVAWSDVDALEYAAANLEDLRLLGTAEDLRDLADRIAALLPPRENGDRNS